MKKIIQLKLAIFAKWVLKKYNVRASSGNYNTEIGAPLTILNQKSGGRNIFKWFLILWQSWWSLLVKTDKNYPEILILEMAADHRGDIEYLVKLAPCKIGIITAIGPSHLEFFGSLEKVIEEKVKIISHLSEKNFAILNADDEEVVKLVNCTPAQIILYGLNESTNFKATEISYAENGQGIMCKVSDGTSNYPAHFKNILSLVQLNSLLAALSVAQIYKIKMEEAIKNLEDFKFPAGRLNLLPGIKHTQIIDDTYNSSPKAVKVALEVLSKIPCRSRRWAVLGDMLELGNYTSTAHREVGEWACQFKVDLLVTVGEKSTDTLQAAEDNGLAPEKVYNFDTADEAKKFIQKEIKAGDLILVKGSQSMRMEKIVKEIMTEPENAKDLLVRQYGKWLDF